MVSASSPLPASATSKSQLRKLARNARRSIRSSSTSRTRAHGASSSFAIGQFEHEGRAAAGRLLAPHRVRCWRATSARTIASPSPVPVPVGRSTEADELVEDPLAVRRPGCRDRGRSRASSNHGPSHAAAHVDRAPGRIVDGDVLEQVHEDVFHEQRVDAHVAGSSGSKSRLIVRAVERCARTVDREAHQVDGRHDHRARAGARRRGSA